MTARSLMFLGTGSYTGKSIVTAAFCRIFARLGYRVAPFKAQNMSLNSAATIDGHEIGRAQALQAEAAGVLATREMNPILLKPQSDTSCQVVVEGRVWGTMAGRDYHQRCVEHFFPVALDSYRRLAAEHDVLVLEGAGSPAEINLKDQDIVNMRMAAAAQASCLLVGDIDCGGVFASLLGTLELLSPDERDLICGVLINKFRGDLSVLMPGLRQIENRINKPCVGVIPYIPDFHLDEEDGVSIATQRARKRGAAPWQASDEGTRPLRVAVIALPFLSNFTDFDAFAAEPAVSLQFVKTADELRHSDFIIIPGTKQTLRDLRWLRDSGLAAVIETYCTTALTAGICGGMQMMGLSISDPHGLEGGVNELGLGLLPLHTVLAASKVTAQVEAELVPKTLFGLPCNAPKTSGYEIHLGETTYEPNARPLFRILRRHDSRTLYDGVEGLSGRCFGTYLHGVFDQHDFRHGLLANARAACGLSPAGHFVFRAKQRQAELDRLADVVEQSVDLNTICSWLELASPRSESKELHSCMKF
jgi:adenosylcobyric acid synthase